MPRPHPPEFRKRAVELARLREKPIAQIAADLGISESCLRNWVHQADVDEGAEQGLSTDERAELVRCIGTRPVPLNLVSAHQNGHLGRPMTPTASSWDALERSCWVECWVFHHVSVGSTHCPTAPLGVHSDLRTSSPSRGRKCWYPTRGTRTFSQVKLDATETAGRYRLPSCRAK